MTLRHISLTMQDWEKRLNSFIEMFDYGILQDAGKVTAAENGTSFYYFTCLPGREHIMLSEFCFLNLFFE